LKRYISCALCVPYSSLLATELTILTGTVTHVRDGDTIEIGGTKIRLHGIDAQYAASPSATLGRMTSMLRWSGADGHAYRRYSNDYVDEEEDASSRKVGMWQGEFMKPWEWRRK